MKRRNRLLGNALRSLPAALLTVAAIPFPFVRGRDRWIASSTCWQCEGDMETLPRLRTRNVFVPGGQPHHTYVSRNEYGLEDEIRASTDNLCKLVTVTGPTKSGKSVLAKRVFPGNTAAWIDGGSVATEDDLWTQVIAQLAAATSTASTEEIAKTTAGGIDIGGEIGVKLIGKASAKASVLHSRASKSTTTSTRTSTYRAAAVAALQQSRRPLVIDDFHYIPEPLQATIIRALKALIYEGHPTIILAIPHRRYDAIRVEREMTSRVQQVHIPPWTIDELRRIPDVGLPLLNATADDGLIELFTAEALGSPHLVQEFFRELCLRAGLQETSDVPFEVRPQPSATALLGDIAKHLSRPVFDALAQGPRQRSDRIPRPFRDGRTGDIYHAVLNAIAQLKPGMGTLSYEQIRSALRELLIDLPQAHEVSRVLEHMSTIQADQEASAPVLDWDKRNRRLHVTDPYFAFFLKWGADVFATEYVAPDASGNRSNSPSSSTQANSRDQSPAKRSNRSPTGAHALARAHSNRIKARDKESDANVPVSEHTLNANERAVLGCLSAASGPLTLLVLAEQAFPGLPPEKANSWVRNSVRKPLRMGLIDRTGSGEYALSKAPKR